MEELHNETPSSLKRCFGLRESITMTAGTVIGVGLFTVGAGAAGTLGPAVILATLCAMLISIYPALLYAEMGSMLPFAGGTYQYAALGLNKPLGMLAGWNFIISMISVASGEALAFSFYIRKLAQALGLNLPLSDKAIAAAAILFFLILTFRGVEISGKLQNGFLFFFWGITLVWMISMLPSLSTQAFSYPLFSQDITISQFLPCVALIWWCFAGFETCCAMGEEICHPQINLPRALFLAPFLVFAVTGLFQWVLINIVPPGSLHQVAAADAPYARGMELAGIAGLPLILLCLGITIGGNCSTLNAAISAPARYLFTMARDRMIPELFSKIHPRFQTPCNALLALSFLTLLLVLTDSIVYIASLSLFSTLLYYIIGMCSALGLRRKYPDLPRPYRAPLILPGACVSIFIYLLLMTQLDKVAVLSGTMWSALGILIYLLRYRNISSLSYSKEEGSIDAVFFQMPESSERKKMDREYKVWRTAVFSAVVLVLLLYLIPIISQQLFPG